MFYRPAFIRSVYGEALLEDFFVSAAGAVLAIRFYLGATGYPSIQIGGLHFAHVLFGGLMMVIAMVMALAFLDRASRELAAVVGGAGFGLFIDEIGKLITRDNNYFYEPAASAIYVSFVLLFLAIRFLARRQALSREACFVNSLEIAEQATIAGLDPQEAQLAFGLLGNCGDQDTAAANLRTILDQAAPRPSPRRRPLPELKQRVDRLYDYLARKWWFSGAVIVFFTLFSITPLFTLLVLSEWSWALVWLAGGALLVGALFQHWHMTVRRLSNVISAVVVVVSVLFTSAILIGLKPEHFSVIDWAQLAAPGVSAIIVVLGLLAMPVSRVRGYRMFQGAIIVSIFFTQVLAFYEYQFLALVGVLIDIAVLLALRYMISHEEARSK
ncbi:MAG: hypothetical protein HY673_16920 [Chloroflexi bacterium]|nr:hypothetical protein [Chloroflexota bacterium]